MIQQNIKVAADALVLVRQAGQYHILLIQRRNDPYKGMWALPGGFVEDDEDLEAAARRELHEETGLQLGHMEQLRTYGAPHRDPRFRCISVVHYAVIDTDPYVQGGDDAADARWFAINALPPLAFDHSGIIQYALQQLNVPA